MFQDSFEKAWQMGAKEWRENSSKEQSLRYNFFGEKYMGYKDITQGPKGTVILNRLLRVLPHGNSYSVAE